jgi:hypothetical protein
MALDALLYSTWNSPSLLSVVLVSFLSWRKQLSQASQHVTKQCALTDARYRCFQLLCMACSQQPAPLYVSALQLQFTATRTANVYHACFSLHFQAILHCQTYGSCTSKHAHTHCQDRTLMIEMKGDQVPEEEVVEAMRLAHTYVLQCIDAHN